MKTILAIGAGGAGSSPAATGETRPCFDRFVPADVSRQRVEAVITELDEGGVREGSDPSIDGFDFAPRFSIRRDGSLRGR